jgi:uncharacterized membrane protein
LRNEEEDLMAGWARTVFTKWLFNGLLALVPLYFTIWVLSILVETADEILQKTLNILPPAYNPDTLIGFHLPGLGLAATVILLISIGALVGNIFGRSVLEASESLLGRIPFVRWFYFSSKEVMEAIFRRDTRSFQRVVLVEFPRKGMHSIGFVTSEATGMVAGMEAKGRAMAVFIPCTPNPTSGYLQIVPENELVAVDWSVDQAFRYVVSAGLIPPAEKGLPAGHPLGGESGGGGR